jgi:carbamoyltransferase
LAKRSSVSRNVRSGWPERRDDDGCKSGSRRFTGGRNVGMTAILGISAFYHDSAAALLVDGRIVAAAQEERFTRQKHDARFPVHAVRYCLAEAGLRPADLDYIAFYEKPLLKFDRLLETYLALAPGGFRSFARALPEWLKNKLYQRRTIREGVGETSAGLVFTEHHESHAASAFFPSPYDEAALLTVDGVGEWMTTALGVGRGHRLELTQEIRFPHSLGLLYSAFTYYCGFKVNSGEYKLMGLAPYGRPIYQDLISQHLIDLKADGSFWLDMRYFNYCQGLTMTSGRFHRLLGGPPRSPESPLEQRHMDLAASIQAVTEEVVLRIARHLHRQTNLPNLVLAGGVALNCVANGRLLREGPFESIWIQPAAGDAGGALGAAWFVWHQLLERPRVAAAEDSQQGSFLGPQFGCEEIARLLERAQAAYRRFDDAQELDEHLAALLAEGKIIGWFQGRMEFGPRALGARSILADPRSSSMQSALNQKIKFRESFRPFAPCVLKEHAHEWFDMPRGTESPYMMFTFPLRADRRLPLSDAQRQTMEHDPDLPRRLSIARSPVPAVTHVDFSARVQTVDEARNPRLDRLLKTFEALTGCPLLVNTSFNVRGEPIVCTPADAWRVFQATEIDVLVLEDLVVYKSDDRSKTAAAAAAHLAQFQLD